MRTSTNTTLTKAKRKRLIRIGREDIIYEFLALKRRNRQLAKSNKTTATTTSLKNVDHHQQESSTVKASSTPSAHMKSKDGITSENCESLEIIIKHLSESQTEEAFLEQLRKYKKGILGKDLFKRLAASLEKEGCERLYSSQDTILVMKQNLFSHKALILDKLKLVQSKAQLPLYIQQHTVTRDNLLMNKPEAFSGVILVVSHHDECFVRVGVGKVLGLVSNDDTQVQIFISTVEPNSELVFSNVEFRVGAVLNWKWNELAVDFNHYSSTLLDPNNNHVDNSDIFAPSEPPTIVFPTSSQNIISHPSQQQSSLFPTSSNMAQTQSFSIVSNFTSPHFSGASSSGTSSSSVAEIIPSFSNDSTIPNFSGVGTIQPTTNVIINSTFEFELEKKNYEERIAQLIKERDQIVLECNALKRLNEELTKSESEAKKRSSKVEYHFKQKKRKIKAAITSVLIEDEDDEVCQATSFIYRGNTYSLTPTQQAEMKTIHQFGVAVDKLAEMFHLDKTGFTNGDLLELEVAVILLATVDTMEDKKAQKKRFDNYRQNRKNKKNDNVDNTL